MARTNKYAILVPLLSILALTGCGKRADEPKPGPPAAAITTTQAEARDVEVVQTSVGQVDSQTVPFVAAEVAGRVIRVNADVGQRVTAGQALAELDGTDARIARQVASAEVNRIQATLANQQRLVERYQKLVQENFVSASMLDNAESQLTASREQLVGAQAQLEAAGRNLGKTRIVAPVSGRVEQRMVAVGDYVTVGKSLFQIATDRALRIHLPFPETLASQLRTGLVARLSTPTAPGKHVEGRVSDIRPMVGTDNRALDVIVDVPNPGNWTPGASVEGGVVLSKHPGAITVPEQSLVLRPAGEVVYAINNGKAEQRVVKTGLRQQGYVEILSGITAGEIVALDGAAFLTDKTPVAVREKRQ
jgi:membrane fusion protein (multidrug efflux system)